jgi:hypothetical protein
MSDERGPNHHILWGRLTGLGSHLLSGLVDFIDLGFSLIDRDRFPGEWP